MTISFGEDDIWIADAVEMHKKRSGAPVSATIRLALVDYLSKQYNTKPEDLPGFSEGQLPAQRRSRAAG